MSELSICTACVGGKTVLTDCGFTAPIKIAKPFYREDHTEVMMMAASAGLLDGDHYDIRVHVGENCALGFTGQSYTKIFRSEREGAGQDVSIRVDSGGKFLYMPCPVIPFAGSRYAAKTEVRLAPDSRFAMCDILSCGRGAMKERFLFDSYRSRTAVYVGEKLVFLDNVRLCPGETDLSGIGFFEGHTHAGVVYLYGIRPEDLPELPGVEAAVTEAAAGICVRMAADSADEIVGLAQKFTMDFFAGEVCSHVSNSAG